MRRVTVRSAADQCVSPTCHSDARRSVLSSSLINRTGVLNRSAVDDATLDIDATTRPLTAAPAFGYS